MPKVIDVALLIVHRVTQTTFTVPRGGLLSSRDHDSSVWKHLLLPIT